MPVQGGTFLLRLSSMSVKKRPVLLAHNPGAGDESHAAGTIIRDLEAGGFDVCYLSLKLKGWESGLNDGKHEAVIVAGGDGTVRKVIRAMLSSDQDHLPLGVLPLGTANNIANVVYGTEDHHRIIGSWRDGATLPFDVAWVEGLKDASFFIEGLGFGVFPALMRAMKLIDDLFSDEPELRLDIALGLMAGIIRSHKPTSCSIIVDGADHSGEYLLVEIMNTGSFGPNIELDAEAVPGDGFLDVVLIPESGRQQLLDYIADRLRGQSRAAGFSAIKGRAIELTTSDRWVHVDDKLLKTKSASLNIELDVAKLQFLGHPEAAGQ